VALLVVLVLWDVMSWCWVNGPDILKESYALVITGYADFLLGLLDPEDGAL